jgi:hypothetical protein
MARLTHTIVSYPDRGPWGDSRYRGNCSGYLIRDLLDTYPVTSVLDPMAGSGTTRDVITSLYPHIPVLTYDLRGGYDILDRNSQLKITNDVYTTTEGRGVDMIFFHPPYWNMIHYGSSSRDFSQGTYPQYLARMQSALTFLSTLLSPTGFIALLLGDLRRRGGDTTYFLSDDTTQVIPLARASLRRELRVIKIQHNTVSSGVTDLEMRFAHEILTILRNARPLPAGTTAPDYIADTSDLDPDPDLAIAGGAQ